jgi:hypothetical protein
MLLIREIMFVAGLTIVFFTVTSAMQTCVVPRGENVFLTPLVFQSLRRLLSLRLHWANSYAVQDRVMAYFAPAGLLLLSVRPWSSDRAVPFRPKLFRHND